MFLHKVSNTAYNISMNISHDCFILALLSIRLFASLERPSRLHVKIDKRRP